MVQVDIFWAYSIGAGFALAASHQLNTHHTGPSTGSQRSWRSTLRDLLATPFLGAAVLYCATVFAPSGIWLLWSFPNWETMQAGDHTLPGWLVAAFTLTNTTQAIAGFLVTGWLIGRGKIRWAALQVVAGYFLMFFILIHGWDGNGYQRFFSTDKAHYRTWTHRTALTNLAHWAASNVALTLYGMGAVMIPLLLALMYRYYRDGTAAAGIDRPRNVTLAAITLGSVFAGALGAAITASLLIRLITTLTANTAIGWILGAASTLTLLWLSVIRRGALTSHAIKWLALPPDTPPARTPNPRHPRP